MIEALKTWIITICTAVFFTTAVQMILPEGSLKKYSNFVLGLIILVVMLNPIVKIFNPNISINNLIETSSAYISKKEYEGDFEKYRDANINNTLNAFKNNLEKQCIRDLEKTFGKDKYKAKVNAQYDKKDNIFLINSIEIGINDGSVERVKNVEIGKESVTVDSPDKVDNKKATEIKDYISSKYDISKNKIYIYRANSVYKIN
ncbi:stage III sporulation protein AF [Clostridium sp. UBA4548]|uniref:stage III sporulation protein AF n=1 Tax=Clostridium sp. UBA4548 TaxID=1946361 RepID=UPI0025B82681|nr:stage III sporulation protein AF [Clostridium sp. UBA4548]